MLVCCIGIMSTSCAIKIATVNHVYFGAKITEFCHVWSCKELVPVLVARGLDVRKITGIHKGEVRIHRLIWSSCVRTQYVCT